MAVGGKFTQRPVEDAGIGLGMRVLDIGCGSGDVSLFAAEIVGSGGSVLGLDREAAPLETARRRARESNVRHIGFNLHGGLAEAIVQMPTQEAEINIDALDDRLAPERLETKATYVADMMFGASARKPAQLAFPTTEI